MNGCGPGIAGAESWARGAPGLREAVLPSLGLWRVLLRAATQDSLPRRYRAWVLLARVRLWALLWAVVVPLWIPLDLALVGGIAGRRLALGRVVVALGLAAAAAACRCKPSQRNVRWAYAILFGTPLLFFVALAPYFQAVAPLQAGAGGMTSAGEVYLSTYRLFPLLIAASIGLLPVTLLEGAGLMAACLLASVAGAVLPVPFVPAGVAAPLRMAELGWLWILMVAGAVGTLAGMSQTALLLQHFRDAVTDPLTGLLNRRAGVNLLALQWEQARRDRRPLSVAMIDLDHFKRINDTHGHEAGDRALVDFAVRLQEALRAGDALIRWGGEEFLAVLPGAAAPEAARRLEQVLRENPSVRPDGAPPAAGRAPAAEQPLTFSAGVAERGRDASLTAEALVDLADRRMYRAKAAGRAAVCAEGPVNEAAPAGDTPSAESPAGGDPPAGSDPPAGREGVAPGGWKR